VLLFYHQQCEKHATLLDVVNNALRLHVDILSICGLKVTNIIMDEHLSALILRNTRMKSTAYTGPDRDVCSPQPG
jgi:hypothetical protein